MLDPEVRFAKYRFASRFWGIPFAIEWSEPDFCEPIRELLLPGWVHDPQLQTAESFRLIRDANGRVQVHSPGDAPDIESKSGLWENLERKLQIYLGSKTREAVFVHAAAVEWKGQAVVFPGASYSGKSTLTQALLQAGAKYLSDEYAIIDGSGLVHSYPRRLSLRVAGAANRRVDPAQKGWAVGGGPLPLGAVVDCRFVRRAKWSPKIISKGDALLTLCGNAVSAILAPEFVLSSLGLAIQESVCIRATRGEAHRDAARILSELEYLLCSKAFRETSL